jgi:hypothetical protein
MKNTSHPRKAVTTAINTTVQVARIKMGSVVPLPRPNLTFFPDLARERKGGNQYKKR